MRLRRLIKKNASLALHRHWCRAAAISLITMVFWAALATLEQLVMLAFNVSSFVDVSSPELMLDNMPNTAPIAMAVMLLVGALSFFVIVPLSLGVSRWFYNITDGKTLATIEIFEYFFSVKGYFRSLWFSLLVFIKKLFWTLVFILPPAAMVWGGNMWRQQASRNIEMLLSVGLEIFGGVLLLLLGWFWLMWMQRYLIAPFILVSDDSVTVRQAIKRSVYLTRGRLLELLLLELSLIGWRIADILIVPRLFTMPYINTVHSLYTRYLSELYAYEQAHHQADEDHESHADDEPDENSEQPDAETEQQ